MTIQVKRASFLRKLDTAVAKRRLNVKHLVDEIVVHNHIPKRKNQRESLSGYPLNQWVAFLSPV